MSASAGVERPEALGRASPRTSPLAAALGLAASQWREVTRQPVFGAVVAAGAALVALSPALAVFAIGRAEALVLDLGASAMLFVGAFLAAAAVSASVAERLGDGTATLVLTRPVGPLAFVAGGFLGSALALVQAGLILGVALLLAARNGPRGVHLGVAVPGVVAVALSLGWGLRASLGRRAFQPAALNAASALLPLAYLASLPLDRSLSVGAPDALDGVAVAAAGLATLASVAFGALGTCLATRLPPAAAAALTLVAFVLGSVAQAATAATSAGPGIAAGGGLLALGWLWLAGVAGAERRAWGLGLLVVPPAAAVYAALRLERAKGPLLCAAAGAALLLAAARVPAAAAIALAVPDLQLYWVADAAYVDVLVPLDYVLGVAGYTALYVVGALGLGAWLLGGRELG